MKTALTALIALVLSANTVFAYCGNDEQATTVAQLAKIVYETPYNVFFEEIGQEQWKTFCTELQDLNECVKVYPDNYSDRALQRAMFWAKLAIRKYNAVSDLYYKLNP
jgi:hypothetical protein